MTDLEEIPQDEHTCCWHFTATSSTYTYWVGGGTVTQEVCCHCGKLRVKQPEPPPIPTGHGKFYPRPQAPTWTFTNTPMVDPTRHCPCRSENGGSGICNCILGSGTVTL